MKTLHLKHRHGGKIVAVSYVGHDTLKGVPYWYYLCEVQWSDNTISRDLEVSPDAVCFDHDIPAAHDEYRVVSDKLMAYLGDQGKWHDMKRARDGRYFSWTPQDRIGRSPL